MGYTVWRIRGELGTLVFVVDRLAALGGRPALVAFGEEGVETWLYDEPAERVQCLVRGLRGVGVDLRDYVAILGSNRPEWIAACLAVICAGADVLREIAAGAGGTTHCASPPERPEEVLDDRHLPWLRPWGTLPQWWPGTCSSSIGLS